MHGLVYVSGYVDEIYLDVSQEEDPQKDPLEGSILGQEGRLYDVTGAWHRHDLIQDVVSCQQHQDKVMTISVIAAPPHS